MPQPEPNKTPKPGRFRSAWLVLRGQTLTPQQIQGEWLEYQQIFDDILTRMSAYLARQARIEKDRVKVQLEQDAASQQNQQNPPTSNKAALRSRVAEMRGLKAGG